ncbi:hypothetical protein PAECIP111893_05063 [Paenibacillus plantiphilus]|uniref:DUF948 domain-containing protein n=1 Tax=Paenibacillus plantiphilus TaxID=2905650 RepID=A0ABN8H594_9BACL|nr:DUF948 domain-containing protein [Paenibacillus plantiphilus]CAH1223998.1 hypothetical protein PAECIP111893_05063 [Paenibacillus plantiphilus]
MMDVAMLIIGLSVAVLVVVLVQTLRKAQTSIDAASKTIVELQQTIHTWKGDVAELVGSARRIADRADSQLAAVEPLMATVKEAGEALHEVASVAHGFSSIWTSKLRRRQEAAEAKEAARAEEAKQRASYDPSSVEASYEGEPGSLHAASLAEAYGTDVHVERRAAGGDPIVMAETAAARQAPAWLDWMETGVHVARLIARR